MKLALLLTAACAASSILFTSCDKSEAGSANALEDFKKASEELNAMTSEKPDASNPMGAMAKAKAVFAKMQSIKTEGLPADLKEAFTAFRSKFSEMATVLKDMPEKKEDLLGWAQKMATDPELGAKIGKIGQELGPLAQKLSEVAKKHGIDVKVGP